MAWLVVDSFTVPVSVSSGASVGRRPTIGQQGRAVSGAMRSSVVARKGAWDFQTAPISTSDRNTLKTKLEGTPPLTCSGDALGASTDCYVEAGSYEERPIPGADRWVVAFTLLEE